MNFFEHQARAKRNSGRLILLLALAVLCLVSLTSIVLTLLLQAFGKVSAYSAESRMGLDWSLIGVIACVVVAVVLFGSLRGSWIDAILAGIAIVTGRKNPPETCRRGAE